VTRYSKRRRQKTPIGPPHARPRRKLGSVRSFAIKQEKPGTCARVSKRVSQVLLVLRYFIYPGAGANANAVFFQNLNCQAIDEVSYLCNVQRSLDRLFSSCPQVGHLLGSLHGASFLHPTPTALSQPEGVRHTVWQKRRWARNPRVCSQLSQVSQPAMEPDAPPHWAWGGSICRCQAAGAC
jgi:hypothetical protein